MFKKKSARPKSKSRTVSFQGRVDDMPLSIFCNDRLQAAYETSKYIVPALPQRKKTQNIHQKVRVNRTANVRSEVSAKSNEFGSQRTNSLLQFGKMAFEIFPHHEVEPCFRTPCAIPRKMLLQAKTPRGTRIC